MTAQDDQILDAIEANLTACLRVSKKPAYWDEVLMKAELNIDRPAAAILIILDHGPCQFRDLVKHLGIEAPSVSRKVHELEDDGLIIRQTTTDKRVHQLSLSNRGHTAAKKLKTAKRSIIKTIITDWSIEDRQQLIRLLEKLATNMTAQFEVKLSNNPNPEE